MCCYILLRFTDVCAGGLTRFITGRTLSSDEPHKGLQTCVDLSPEKEGASGS